MNWFARLFAKSVAPESQLVMLTPPTAKGMAREANAYIREGFAENSVVFSSVSKVSGAIASVKPLLKRRLNGSADEIINKHPVLSLLERPNRLQTYRKFVESTFGFYGLTGNAFIQGVGPSPKRAPTELYNLNPTSMRVIPGKLGIPAAYEFQNANVERRFEVDAVNGNSAILHLKTFNPMDHWLGLSPISAAAMSVDQHNSANRWNTSLLQNSGRPAGALVLKPSSETGDAILSENQRESLRREIDSALAGPKNAGRILLLEGGMDWKQISLSPDDLDWIQGKHVSAREIALIFGVPPQLLGIPGDNTFSNYEEARLAFWQDTIVPLCEDWFNDLNNWLMPSFGDPSLYLCPDWDSVHALDSARQKKWDRVSNASFLTTNEKREAVGYGRYKPSEEPADMILINVGLSPLDDVGIELPGEVVVDDEQPTDEPPPPASEESEEDSSDELDTESTDELSEEPDETGKSVVAYFEGKAADLKSPRARERFRQMVVRKRLRMEKQYRAAINQVWRKEAAAVAAAASKSDASNFERLVGQAIDNFKPEMTRVMEANTRRLMKSFGADVLSAGKSIAFGQNIETKDAETRFDSFVNEFVEDHVGEKIVGIYQTSRKRVIRELRETFKEAASGESELTPNRLIETVKGIYSKFTAERSFTIVRTESGTASNTALRKAAAGLSVPLEKGWIAEMTDRTRDSHRAMHETFVPMDEKYLVPSKFGEVEMDGPGDPSGPAEEVINCLCVQVFRGGNNAEI